MILGNFPENDWKLGSKLISARKKATEQTRTNRSKTSKIAVQSYLPEISFCKLITASVDAIPITTPTPATAPSSCGTEIIVFA